MAVWECSYLIYWKCCWWLFVLKWPPTRGVGATDADFFHLCFLSRNNFGSSEAPDVPMSTSPEKLHWCEKYVWKLVKDDPSNHTAYLESFCGLSSLYSLSYHCLSIKSWGISCRFQLFGIAYVPHRSFIWIFFCTKEQRNKKISQYVFSPWLKHPILLYLTIRLSFKLSEFWKHWIVCYQI